MKSENRGTIKECRMKKLEKYEYSYAAEPPVQFRLSHLWEYPKVCVNLQTDVR